jgi:hypothetical protein
MDKLARIAESVGSCLRAPADSVIAVPFTESAPGDPHHPLIGSDATIPNMGGAHAFNGAQRRKRDKHRDHDHWRIMRRFDS